MIIAPAEFSQRSALATKNIERRPHDRLLFYGRGQFSVVATTTDNTQMFPQRDCWPDETMSKPSNNSSLLNLLHILNFTRRTSLTFPDRPPQTDQDATREQAERYAKRRKGWKLCQAKYVRDEDFGSYKHEYERQCDFQVLKPVDHGR